MTVVEIVKEYLKENGYDGLCSPYCGCGVNNLDACDSDFSECVPAYKVPYLVCLECEDFKQCAPDVDEEIYCDRKPK
ncbi:MAG: hypothetical protein FWD87_11010 [Spirochaetaceae bacterium]|nr:hypothetical protein [Spirochaetaceae bacterium]